VLQTLAGRRRRRLDLCSGHYSFLEWSGHLAAAGTCSAMSRSRFKAVFGLSRGHQTYRSREFSLLSLSRLWAAQTTRPCWSIFQRPTCRLWRKPADRLAPPVGLFHILPGPLRVIALRALSPARPASGLGSRSITADRAATGGHQRNHPIIRFQSVEDRPSVIGLAGRQRARCQLVTLLRPLHRRQRLVPLGRPVRLTGGEVHHQPFAVLQICGW
jgi:hypothetical protein